MVNRIEVNPEDSYGLELVEIKRGIQWARS